MAKSDTPMSDAALYADQDGLDAVPADFARAFERSVSATLRSVEELCATLEEALALLEVQDAGVNMAGKVWLLIKRAKMLIKEARGL